MGLYFQATGLRKTPSLKKSCHCSSFTFPFFPTSQPFSSYQKKTHAKKALLFLEPSSLFDSSLCSVAQLLVCCWVPFCSLLWAFPVHWELWRSINGWGGAYLSKHSSWSTLEKTLVLPSLLAGHRGFGFWSSGISLLLRALLNRGSGQLLEQLPRCQYSETEVPASQFTQSAFNGESVLPLPSSRFTHL